MPVISKEQEEQIFNIDELTQGTIDGNGTFDVLMKSVKAHLKYEFDAGRIRGTDYANVYVQTVGVVLAQSTQYATSRARLESELSLIAAQTRQAEQDIKTSIQQEKLLFAQTSHTNKQELQTVQETVNLVKQGLQIEAQTLGIKAQTAIDDYRLVNILPTEKDNIIKQGLAITAQTELNNKQTLDVVEGTKLKSYQLLNVLPIEVSNLTKQGLALDAQTIQTTQQTTNLVTQNLMTIEQTKGVKAESAIKDYQLVNILPIEKANLTATGLNIVSQTANTTQQTANLLSQKTLQEAKHILELQAIEVQIGKTTADTVLTTKQCLLTEAQATTQAVQSENLAANTRQTDYVTSFQIPSQIASAEAQTELVNKQVLQTTQQTLNVIAQRTQLDKQNLDIEASTTLKTIEAEIQTFNKDFRLPKELLVLDSDIAYKTAQVTLSNKEILVKQSQVDLANKELLVKQNVIDLGTKELVLKQAQIGITEKELLIKAEQLLITKYELANKLPADVALSNSQTELYGQKAKTEKAQLDSTVIGANSVVDINNKLIKEQTSTLLRSSEQTAAKLLIDTWNTRHTQDPDGNLENAANKLQDATIGKAVQAVMSGIGITTI